MPPPLLSHADHNDVIICCPCYILTQQGTCSAATAHPRRKRLKELCTHTQPHISLSIPHILGIWFQDVSALTPPPPPHPTGSVAQPTHPCRSMQAPHIHGGPVHASPAASNIRRACMCTRKCSSKAFYTRPAAHASIRLNTEQPPRHKPRALRHSLGRYPLRRSRVTASQPSTPLRRSRVTDRTLRSADPRAAPHILAMAHRVLA